MKYLLNIIMLFAIFSCDKPTEKKYKLISKVPNLEMPNNHLKFNEIEDYKNYKIIATHFRTDKNELRYILANDKAFKAYNKGIPFPDGSKIVKIGWTVKKMKNFNAALEADDIQRIEYMVKDRKRFVINPGKWGYARFVKKDNKYKAWSKGTKSCVSCHNLAKDNDYLFTKMQKIQ